MSSSDAGSVGLDGVAVCGALYLSLANLVEHLAVRPSEAIGKRVTFFSYYAMALAQEVLAAVPECRTCGAPLGSRRKASGAWRALRDG